MVRRKKMKKAIIVLSVIVAFLAGSMGAAHAKFPAKTIKIIVYLKPGGAGDVFARKFTAIAEKYTDASFVIVNKPGAGGVIAIKHILKKSARRLSARLCDTLQHWQDRFYRRHH